MENETLKQYIDKLEKEKEKPKHWYDQYSYPSKRYQNIFCKRLINYNNNGYSSGDEEDWFYANEYSRPKKSKSKKNQKVIYVPVNEDEVDLGENNFTDGHDFEDEDDTIDDYEKNGDMVIDDKYLDDEELSNPQTEKQLN